MTIGLPPPEVESAHSVAEHAGFEQTLTGIVDGSKDGVACEGKDHCIGMQWAQPSKGEVFSKVSLPIRKLERNDCTYQHSNKSPYSSSDHEIACDLVIECDREP